MHTNHTNAKLLKPVHADQIAKAKRITDRIRTARAAKPVILPEDVTTWDKDANQIIKDMLLETKSTYDQTFAELTRIFVENCGPLSQAEQDKAQHEWI